MRIAIDAMGGDHGPAVVAEGALRILPRLEPGTELLLVGEETELRSALGKRNVANVEIVHAPDVVDMHEPPASAVRRKPQSSISVAIRLVQEGQADAVLSCGNTGAVVAGSLFKLGRIQEVQRPAIATIFPTRGSDCVVLDVGANADCKPSHMMQFGIMGAVYARIQLGCEKPRVGLLNIGEEEGKGNELAVATYPLLRDSGIRFVGNVEGRDLLAGRADVVVCDGYTGNIVLKFGESILGFTRNLLRREIQSSRRLKLGALLLQPALLNLKKRLDYQERGGAPLLGVDGIVIIAHGKSSTRAIGNAVLSCAKLVQNKLTTRIAEQLNEARGELFAKNEQRSDLGNR